MVTAITTAHKATDKVTKKRKRPAGKSANAVLARKQFGSEYIKDLDIPTAIDDYNHGMNGVDIANQLRNSFTIQRDRNNYKWPKVFLYYFIDVAMCNAYLIYRKYHAHTGHHDRKAFQQAVANSLLWSSSIEHVPTKLAKPTYCRWRGCRTRSYRLCVPLGELKNERQDRRGRQTRDFCELCRIPLCVNYGCWKAYHA